MITTGMPYLEKRYFAYATTTMKEFIWQLTDIEKVGGTIVD